MWVDKGAILVAKTFPLVAQSAHWNQCTFKAQGKSLDSPSGKRVALFFTHHHTTRCCVKGILQHSAPFVVTCFLLLASFLFLLKIFWRALHLSIGCWFFQWIATGTNRVRPGRPSHGSYASTKILNLHLSALGKIDQLLFETTL